MENPYRLWTLTSVLILFYIVGSSIHQTQSFISNACYGTALACDYFDLQCLDNSVIRLTNLVAGRKNETMCPVEDHCNKEPDCCTNASGDPQATFNLEHTYNAYRNCSGRANCTRVQAPWQVINRTTGATSSYVQLEYVCDKVADKLPLCGGSQKKTSKVTNSIDIWFDGSTETFDQTKASKECKCSINNISPLNTTLTLGWVDVRLESHYRAVNASSALCSNAILTAESFFRRCSNSTDHWTNNFLYDHSLSLTPSLLINRTTEVRLQDIYKNGARDAPAMVWIKVNAFPETQLNITCEEVIPAELTTTTTSPPPPTTTTTTPTTTTEKTTTLQPTTTTITITTTSPTTTVTPLPPPPTTTTPEPTTTTPKPTTTPPPTTTTTTTPKPTTTLPPTTTTPKPTTTLPPTTTTPKPTTTLPQTTTAEPTTTPAPPSTTPAPTEITPTPTTPMPTTTSTPTTTPTPITTTQMPTTSTIQSSTAVPPTTKPAARIADKKESGKSNELWYLAIFLPIGVGITAFVIFVMWCYYKRTSANRPLKLAHPTKKTRTRSEIHRYFNGASPLDDIIMREHGSYRQPVYGSRPPSLYSIWKPVYTAVPELTSVRENPLYTEPKRPEPYIIPVNVTNDPLDDGSSIANGGNMPGKRITNISLHDSRKSRVSNGGPSVKVGAGSNPASDLSQSVKNLSDVYVPSQTSPKSATRDPEKSKLDVVSDKKKLLEDGAVTIHVDNISNPSISHSARSERSSVTSGRSTLPSERTGMSQSDSVAL